MNSKILAKLPVRLPKEEVRLILDFQDDSQEYSEFHFGDWKTYVIWNQSGQDDDGRVADHGQAARPTPRGLGLAFLNNWMVRTFDVSKLKLARIHSMGEGVLIPHRDFVEFGKHMKPWTRVHVPLVTNSSCMHSDESTVFRMRQGEVWFLDAENLHSAVNFSTERRLNLCLDFDIGHAEVADVLLPAAFNDMDSLTPELVRRPPLEVSFEDTLLSLAAQLCEQTMTDTVGYLAKVHFERDVSIEAFFEWTTFVAMKSASASMLEKISRYNRFLKSERSMGERFLL